MTLRGWYSESPSVAFVEELPHLLSGFELRSRRTFMLHDHPYRVSRTNGQSHLMLGEEARELLSSLLYDALHCRRSRDLGSAGHRSAALAVRDLTNRLSESNTGTGCWQAGWIVAGRTGERIEVAKHGIHWFVFPQQVRTNSNIAPGTSVLVRIGKEQRELFPGFYMAFGNADDDPKSGLLRLYWNISVKGAALLVSEVANGFNGAAIPFRLKLLNVPTTYGRTDAAVLYIPRDRYRDAHPIASQVHQKVRQYLSPTISAFAKPIAHGIGLAEDPGPGRSFGQHVAGILSEALSTSGANVRGIGKRFHAVLEALRARGIDPEKPYLVAGSMDGYRVLDG